MTTPNDSRPFDGFDLSAPDHYDVADTILFFCTEGAKHITGEFIMTDAGLHLSMTPLARR